MGASAGDVSSRLAEATRELALARLRESEGAGTAAALRDARAEVARLRGALLDSEALRRKLHNTVQELRGSVRVMLRVRPPLGGEEAAAAGAAGEGGVTLGADGASIEVALPAAAEGGKAGAPGAASGKPGKPVRAAFDRVFGPADGQAAVFEEVSTLVQSGACAWPPARGARAMLTHTHTHTHTTRAAALDGYHVCIFSYGQTGSGKTYTMQGGSGDSEGLIPRSVKQILRTVATLSSQGWAYAAEASFLEIYNEALRDLLARAPPAGGGGGGGGAPPPPLTLHQDAEGNVTVPGLTRCAVTREGDVGELLARAAARRATAATAMNAHSSRSHAVFTLHLRGTHEGGGGGAGVAGSLSLVDLAGSERLARSGAEGDRKKEAAAINKSLSCLADVFTALGKRAPHVPFRNSRLTWLLSPALRGEGKTLMLVGVSPAPGCAAETLCSVRFAAAVSQVELRGGGGGGGGGGGPRTRAPQPAALPPPPTPTQPPPPQHAAAAAALDAGGVHGLLDVSYMEEGAGACGEGEGEGRGEGGAPAMAVDELDGGESAGQGVVEGAEAALCGVEEQHLAAAAPPPVGPAARSGAQLPPPPGAGGKRALSASALAGGGGGGAVRGTKRGVQEGAGADGGKKARMAASFAGRA